MDHATWLTSADPAALLHYLQVAPVGVGGRRRGTEEGGPRLISDRKLRLFVEALRCERCAKLTADMSAIDAAVYAGTADCGTPAEKAAILRDLVFPFRPVSLPEERIYCGACGWEGCTHDSGECRCSECGADAWIHDRGWLTPTVIALANAAYSERRDDGALCPDRLAVLSDALMEAGCSDEALLRHLRGWERCANCLSEPGIVCGSGPAQCTPCNGTGWVQLRGAHWRGCAVIDALTGRE